jgi:hypothetical protein
MDMYSKSKSYSYGALHNCLWSYFTLTPTSFQLFEGSIIPKIMYALASWHYKKNLKIAWSSLQWYSWSKLLWILTHHKISVVYIPFFIHTFLFQFHLWNESIKLSIASSFFITSFKHKFGQFGYVLWHSVILCMVYLRNVHLLIIDLIYSFTNLK